MAGDLGISQGATTINDFMPVSGISTSLTEADLAKYIELHLDGSPESIAEARTLWHGAYGDAGMVRRCRDLIALIERLDTEVPDNTAALESIENERSELLVRINNAENRLAEIAREESNLSCAAASPAQKRRDLYLSISPDARIILADELAAVGPLIPES